MARQRHKTKNVKETLSVTHPELVAEWHPTKNGDPIDVREAKIRGHAEEARAQE
jgi:hypothetical protein